MDRRYVQADAAKDDLRHISDPQLATVYRQFYWNAVSGHDLPDGVDYAVFDFAVNSGPARAARYLQAACGVGLAEDGVIGPAARQALSPISDDALRFCPPVPRRAIYMYT